jgi:hypothetical protein
VRMVELTTDNELMPAIAPLFGIFLVCRQEKPKKLNKPNSKYQ